MSALFEHEWSDGVIVGRGRRADVRYRIRVLSPGELHDIRLDRAKFLRERGITECTTATAEIYQDELKFRTLAAAVRKWSGDEALATLDEWRKHIGPAVRTCIDHYRRLEVAEYGLASEEPNLELIEQIRSFLAQQEGVGDLRFWASFDYDELVPILAYLFREDRQSPD